MDMRVDAARDHDLPRGVDHPPGAEHRKAARRADGGDFFAGDADVGGFRARGQDGETARNDDVEHVKPPMRAKPPR
jgi:hypothetical protein